MNKWILTAVVCTACIDWTRFSGTVKAVNLKESTVTIQNRDGDLFIIPIDYQVQITEKHGEKRGLLSLQLDEKITLIRMQKAEPPKAESFEEMNKLKG